MERFRYDRSSKWLIEHHGDSILRLAGVDDVIAWKPLAGGSRAAAPVARRLAGSASGAGNR